MFLLFQEIKFNLSPRPKLQSRSISQSSTDSYGSSGNPCYFIILLFYVFQDIKYSLALRQKQKLRSRSVSVSSTDSYGSSVMKPNSFGFTDMSIVPEVDENEGNSELDEECDHHHDYKDNGKC
ncbi:hypothetical protein KUTeg_020141 [Tegillarca granosa]|uniref:Uncharacterized protein n=1 Tax=Tegillarca granosa TaxID=220873 RepID=A0ABQ9E9N5_TEGGR|nr:hypothetical protein KUTeg_020141 [Tegillarca granosa]